MSANDGSDPIDDQLLNDTLGLDACDACPALVDCRSQIVDGVGPVDADIVLVGEAPGANEDEHGVPFTGRSGDILDETLDAVGLDREEIRITNCVRCRPPENRDPHVAELDNCSPYLFEELHRTEPDVVVPLGRIPTEQLLGDRMTESVTTLAGDQFTEDEYEILVSVHPAATIYNRSLRPTFEETFETVAQISSSG